MDDKGFVYVLRNECMPNIYKIGLTRGDVKARVGQLSNTSVPTDFKCILSMAADHALQLERFIHRNLSGKRINSKREFFYFVGDDHAVSMINDIAARFKPRKYTEKEKVIVLSVKGGSSASKQAKEAGLKSLLHVSEITGVRTSTLNNWYNHKPKLFDTVLIGCARIQYEKLKATDNE